MTPREQVGDWRDSAMLAAQGSDDHDEIQQASGAVEALERVLRLVPEPGPLRVLEAELEELRARVARMEAAEQERAVLRSGLDLPTVKAVLASMTARPYDVIPWPGDGEGWAVCEVDGFIVRARVEHRASAEADAVGISVLCNQGEALVARLEELTEALRVSEEVRGDVSRQYLVRTEERDRARYKADQAFGEVKAGLAREQELRAALAVVKTDTEGVWRWMGDGFDHPDSSRRPRDKRTPSAVGLKATPPACGPCTSSAWQALVMARRPTRCATRWTNTGRCLPRTSAP